MTHPLTCSVPEAARLLGVSRGVGYEPATSAVLPRILAVLDGPTTCNDAAGNGAVAKTAGAGDGHGSG